MIDSVTVSLFIWRDVLNKKRDGDTVLPLSSRYNNDIQELLENFEVQDTTKLFWLGINRIQNFFLRILKFEIQKFDFGFASTVFLTFLRIFKSQIQICHLLSSACTAFSGCIDEIFGSSCTAR